MTTRNEYERRKEKGECVICRQDAEPGRVLCAECLAKSQQRVAELRKYRKQNHKCLQCNNPAEPGHSLCAQHMEASRVYHQAYYDAGKAKSIPIGEAGAPQKRASAKSREVLPDPSAVCSQCGSGKGVVDDPDFGKLCSRCKRTWDIQNPNKEAFAQMVMFFKTNNDDYRRKAILLMKK